MADGSPTIALLGLGEAGGRFARDLREAGIGVRGWDPLPETGPDAASASEAADGADIVLSANSAADAATAARSVLDVLRPGQRIPSADRDARRAQIAREAPADLPEPQERDRRRAVSHAA